MFLVREFVRKYPQAVVLGPVPIGYLVEKLKRLYRAQEISLEQFPPFRVRMQTENAYYYGRDEQRNVQMEDIQMRAVKVPVTDETVHYTQRDFVSWDGETDAIYVFYDEKTGYFYCNSSMLHLELKLAMGISELDAEHKTENYTEYLGLMQRYIEDYMDLGRGKELIALFREETENQCHP